MFAHFRQNSVLQVFSRWAGVDDYGWAEGWFSSPRSGESQTDKSVCQRGLSTIGIVEGKLTSGSSGESLSDGLSTLKRGLISRETLTRRLGHPVGTCHVADSEVWIYDFTLSSPLNNGRELTTRGHLHVFVEPIPFLGLYLHNFELAIDGSGLERWADNDPRLQ